MFGVDYSEGYDIPSLTQFNTKFVVRYIGYTSPGLPQTKILTLQEVEDLTKAGIAIVSNFEWSANRASQGYTAGVQDALLADKLHTSLGGPSNRPIYFSVDYNTDGTDTVPYFQGLASVLGLSRVGVYGNYATVKYLANKSLASWYWQTYAWSNGLTYSGNHLYQYLNGVQMGSMIVDYDDSQTSDYGQWHPGSNAKFMEQQFTDVYNIGVTAGYGSLTTGLAQMYLAAFLQHKMSACHATCSETPTVDFAGNAIIYQTLSNGFHGEWSNGNGILYDGYNKGVYNTRG